VALQGKMIDAQLETAINTDLPGQIRAIVSSPLYAEQGRDALVEPGSRLNGVYNTAIRKGASPGICDLEPADPAPTGRKSRLIQASPMRSAARDWRAKRQSLRADFRNVRTTQHHRCRAGTYGSAPKLNSIPPTPTV